MGEAGVWAKERRAEVYHVDPHCPALGQAGRGAPIETDPDDHDRPCRMCSRAPFAEPEVCRKCGADLDGRGECPFCAALAAMGVSD